VAGVTLQILLQTKHFRLEARVGIGRLMPCFHEKNTPLSEQTQYNLALSSLNCFNPLTEGFTECDMRSLEQLFVMASTPV
jgi:hypothetical protein